MARESYIKQNWENKPSKKTPVRAEELLHIENGIYNNSENMALREIYEDSAVSFGRKAGTAKGTGSVAFGANLEASGYHSGVFGANNTASAPYSGAFGISNTVSGNSGFVEGASNIVSGANAHGEGANNKAEGSCSHTEGVSNEAGGPYSHTEGAGGKAGGMASHTEGGGSIAGGDFQHVQGKYNIEDTEGTYAHIVGNGGSDTERSNAHTLDWNGNAWFAGDITNGNGVSLDSLKTMLDDISGTAAEVTAMTYEETMTILNREETV